MNKLIWVKVSCNNKYRLINNMQLLNIKLYEIKYDNDIIYFKIDNNDLLKLNKYLSNYKFKKVSNTGINKVIDKIKEEKVFLIAIFIGLIVFIILNNMIYKVNIIHESKEIRELIQEELDSYGIKELSFKKSYDELNSIRQEILDKYPTKLDWMEFEVKGMIINVRVEERIITDTKKVNKYCNLVATKAGIINDIVMYDGEARVMLNDYVRKGDILISGEVTYNEEAKRYTCASGEVYATTWYTIDVSIPFEHIEYQETDKSRYNLVVENNGNKKDIFKSRLDNHSRDYHTILKIFSFQLYLAKDTEVKKNILKYSEEEAINMGIKKAEESILTKINDTDTIITKKVLKKVVNNSTMDIDVFIVTKELISTEEEIIITEGLDS